MDTSPRPLSTWFDGHGPRAQVCELRIDRGELVLTLVGSERRYLVRQCPGAAGASVAGGKVATLSRADATAQRRCMSVNAPTHAGGLHKLIRLPLSVADTKESP